MTDSTKKDPIVMDFLKKGLESGNMDAMSKMFDTVMKANTDMLGILTKTSEERFSDYMESFKKQLNEIYPTEHYQIKHKELDLEHQREMLRMGFEMAKSAEESNLNKIKVAEEIRKDRYEEHLEASMGIIRWPTKYKRAVARLLAEKDATLFEAKLNNMGSGFPQLPHNKKDLLEE